MEAFRTGMGVGCRKASKRTGTLALDRFMFALAISPFVTPTKAHSAESLCHSFRNQALLGFLDGFVDLAETFDGE